MLAIAHMIHFLFEAGVLGNGADSSETSSKAAEGASRDVEIMMKDGALVLRLPPRNEGHESVLRRLRLYRLVSFIVHRQQDYLFQKVPYLKHLTLREAGLAVGIPESTASRLLQDVWLRNAANRVKAAELFHDPERSEEVTILQRIVDAENPVEPLTDDEISTKLHLKYKIRCARRTVAKYRSLLGIPSAAARKQSRPNSGASRAADENAG